MGDKKRKKRRPPIHVRIGSVEGALVKPPRLKKHDKPRPDSGPQGEGGVDGG